MPGKDIILHIFSSFWTMNPESCFVVIFTFFICTSKMPSNLHFIQVMKESHKKIADSLNKLWYCSWWHEVVINHFWTTWLHMVTWRDKLSWDFNFRNDVQGMMKTKNFNHMKKSKGKIRLLIFNSAGFIILIQHNLSLKTICVNVWKHMIQFNELRKWVFNYLCIPRNRVGSTRGNGGTMDPTPLHSKKIIGKQRNKRESFKAKSIEGCLQGKNVRHSRVCRIQNFFLLLTNDGWKYFSVFGDHPLWNFWITLRHEVPAIYLQLYEQNWSKIWYCIF